MDGTEKNNPIQERIPSFLLQQYRDQRLICKNNSERNGTNNTTKGRPTRIHLKEQVTKDLKRLIESIYLERATGITED